MQNLYFFKLNPAGKWQTREEIENATSESYSVPNEMLASNKGNELCYKCQFSDGKSTENVWFDVEVGLVDLSQTITVNGKAVEENDDGYYVVDRSDKPVLGFSINDGNSYKYQWSKYSNKEEEYIEIKSGTTSTGADASLALEDSTYDDYRLRLTDSDGNYDNWYYNLKFTDPVPVTYVSLSQDTLSLDTGKTGQLTAIVAPADAANTNVTWTSSDESVATVDEYGEVTAVKAGTATITVTTEDGGKTATCQVTVNYPKSDTISVIAVSLSKYEISLKPGESDTLKATLAPQCHLVKNATKHLNCKTIE